MDRGHLISEINEVIRLLELEEKKPSVTGYFSSITEILRMMQKNLLSESISADFIEERQSIFSGLMGILGRDWYFEGSPLGKRIQSLGRAFTILPVDKSQRSCGILYRISKALKHK